MNNYNNNNICLKSNIQTSSVDVIILYTSVPTSDTELSSINAEIDDRINCYNVRDIFITPAHINTCISQLRNISQMVTRVLIAII